MKTTSHKHRRLFWLSVLAGLIFVLACAFMSRPHYSDSQVKPLAQGFNVTSQIQLADIRRFRIRGISTIIDLRPDGEAADQPSSSLVKEECQRNGLHFAYVPVQHGAISDKSVHDLKEAIELNPEPVLLYCRSGKRAVRTFCLAEASRSDGGTLDEILAMAKSAGQSADDLTAELNARIAHRPATSESEK